MLTALLGQGLAWSSPIGLVSGNKRVALVIGNDAYQNVGKLDKAGNDALAMARELKLAGFTVTLERDVNYREMVKKIDFFTSHISGGDQVVVFFAGHGVQLKSGSYLLPVDIEATSENEVEKTSYALNDLMDKLSEAKASFALMLIDACRDNPLKTNGRSLGATRGLLPPDPPKGQMVVYSASKGQQALDRLDEHDANPNGVFTREFIARMEKPGVRIEELVREVQDAVEDLARTVGHDQRPALYNEARGNFFFFAPTTVQAPGAELNLPVPITPVTASPAAAPDAAPQSFHAFIPELKPGGVFRDCQECPSMVVIPAGTFVMGSDAKEQSLAFPNNAKAAGRESPQHPVSVQRFAAGQYALTKAEFTAFVRATSYKTEAERGGGCVLAGAKGGANNWSNPGFAQGDDHPVVCVSWNDAKAYVQWLSKRTGAPYRLLSESEREYVARAGTITAFWWGDTVHTDQANYDGMAAPYNGSPKGQYRRETVAVSSFDANPFGLYGVHGNVLDWVEDCDNPNYLGAPADGKAWTSGDCDFHMQRGGDWVSEAADLRSAARLTARSDFANAVYGFRVARSIAVNQ